MFETPKQVIVLAAGRGTQADGMAKCLIRHPITRRTVLDHVIEAFEGKEVVVVVGFRAIQVMDHYPHLDFIINEHWSDTNNAMSLGLALDDQATYVVPGDVFVGRALVDELDEAAPDLALVARHENRIPTAVNGIINDVGALTETYQGAVRDASHPELVGVFKASSPQLLREWRQSSVRNGHQFAGVTLPCGTCDVRVHDVGLHTYDEVNTAADYLRLLQRTRQP